MIFAGIATLVLLLVLKSKTISTFQTAPILFSYAIFVTVFQLIRLTSALFFKRSLKRIISEYKHVDGYFPSVTFVVPCKNEEGAIYNTLIKCFEADYPKDMIEVIAINDGSTDYTLEEMRRVQKKHPNLVLIDWKINQGKREGMAAGFRLAKGDIIVQLDSDSYINPKTFYKIVEPFKNPTIGAVCAHAHAQNADRNVITRMQEAYYYTSFRIMKAAESTFSTVFCCSGCASAYRKDVALPLLNEWLTEKFLGNLVTYGDDRSLTGYILRGGFKTIYSDEVVAYTIVPETKKQFYKQQLRWKKSWIINGIFTFKYIFKRDPFIATFYFVPLMLISILAPIFAFWGLIALPIINNEFPWLYLLGIFLLTSLFLLYYRFTNPYDKYWKYFYLWQALNSIFLSYIIVIALFKINDRGWGTR